MATYVVTVATDESNGDLSAADLSLREAIELANASAGADEIRFGWDVDYIALQDALPAITDDLTIDGNGTTIDANLDGDLKPGTRPQYDWSTGWGFETPRSVLEIVGEETDVVIQGLVLTGGIAKETGGGIYAPGISSLTIRHSSIVDNLAGFRDQRFLADHAKGGGIFADASQMTIEYSEISGNRASGDYGSGGGVYSVGPLSMSHTTVHSNSAGGGGYRGTGEGGGLYLAASSSIVDSIISKNEVGGYDSAGGGISAEVVTVIRSTIRENTAGASRDVSGGGIHAEGLTLVQSTVLYNRIEPSHNSLRPPEIGGAGIDARNVNISRSIILDNTYIYENYSYSDGLTAFRGGSLAISRSSVSDGIVVTGGYGWDGIYSARSVILRNAGLIDGSILTADDEGRTAVRLIADNAGLFNEGRITSDLGAGIFLSSNDGEFARIENTGEIISGRDWGISFGLFAEQEEGMLWHPVFTGDAVVVNSGTIRGGHGAVLAGDGNDTVTNTGTIIGNVNLGPGDDVFNTSQGVFTGVVRGGAGNDHLSGNAAANDLRGDAGDDILQGGRGDDVLNGGLGADRMVGGRGNDTYYVNEAGDRVVEGLGGAAGGRDTVHASVSFRLPDHVEVLFLTGTANINGTGNALANAISGNRGINALRGMDGNDVIQSGAGADVLIGGRGRDVFKYTGINGSTPAAPDRIAAGNGAVAFELPGRGLGDRIDLSAIDANALLAGKQDFVFGSAKGIGRLWAVNVGEVTMIRGNVDARPGPELQIAILDGWVDASAYTRDDFIL